ncbi:MAG: hypothetical protein R3C97_14110 [Geminicoccaceae bacterium]
MGPYYDSLPRMLGLEDPADAKFRRPPRAPGSGDGGSDGKGRTIRDIILKWLRSFGQSSPAS